ncbi:MAG: hypothetical protein JWL60_2322, partial [Gemmatimonadetes bacterium]|nr:hypothetical protein [Gemmatimonadota bacterium]
MEGGAPGPRSTPFVPLTMPRRLAPARRALLAGALLLPAAGALLLPAAALAQDTTASHATDSAATAARLRASDSLAA